MNTLSSKAVTPLRLSERGICYYHKRQQVMVDNFL